MEKIILTIDEESEGIRLDKLLASNIDGFSRTAIQKLIDSGSVCIGEKRIKASYAPSFGEVVEILIPEPEMLSVEPENIPLDIIYEDNDILIVNKPRGLLVHGDEGEKRITLANQVINYLYFKGEYDPKSDKGFAPAPAHRLDRNTSGLVVFAKNLPSLQELEDLFKEKEEIKKEYQALVVGHLQGEKEIDAPLKKDMNTGLVQVARDGKSAVTKVKPVKYNGDYTLVNVQIFPGRTHQIRVQLASIGFPVVGDAKYGDFKVNKEFRETFKFENQFVYAYKLTFGKLKGKLSYLSDKSVETGLPDNELKVLGKINN